MKKYLFCLLLSLVAVNVSAIDIKEAVKQKIVSVVVLSTGKHMGNAAVASVKNLTSKAANIEFPQGLLLMDLRNDGQNLVLSQTTICKLAPKQKASLDLEAYCVEISDACPIPKLDTFMIGGIANDTLLTILNEIKELKQINYTAQMAVWAALGQQDLNEVDGVDSTAIMQLRSSLSKLTGRFVRPYSGNYRRRVSSDTTISLAINAQGTDILNSVKNGDVVTYALYNANDSAVVKVETIKLDGLADNKYRLQWRLDTDVLDSKQAYYMRILVNNVIRKEYMYDYWF